MLDRISDSLKEIKPSGIRKFFDLVNEKDDIISFGVGEPDFPTPQKIIDATFEHLNNGMTNYTSNYGMEEFRVEVSNYLKKYKLDYRKEEIIATVGGSEAIDLALRSIINDGDEIIIPEPVYVPYKPLARLAGAKTISINTSETGFKLCPKELEKKITDKTKALILCYPNNPTGVTLSKEELGELAKVIKKHNIWVITDEVYSELNYNEKHYSIGGIEGMKNNTIYINGFSKAFSMTGWRIGYLCGPEKLINEMIKIHQYSTLCAPIIGQLAGIEALKVGMDDMRSMKEEFSERREFLYNGLRKLGVEVEDGKGALYLFPKVKKYNMTGEEFSIHMLSKYNIALVPGSAFGRDFVNYVRISYASSMENLEILLEAFEHFIKNN